MREREIEQVFLLGDEAESARWVAFVRHKADDFAKHVSPNDTLTKRLFIPNGWAMIKLRKGRRKYFIYTESGGPQYEFFTSEDVETQPFGSPNYNSYPDPAEAYVCGKFVWVQMEGTSPKAQPLVELCGRDCPGDNTDLDVTWPVYDCANVEAESLTKTPTAWQNQRAYEDVWFPSNKGDTFVTSAAGSVPGYSGLGKLSRFNYVVGQLSERFWEDRGFDLKPSIYAYGANEPSAYGAPELTAPNYYRHACTHVAEGRTFMVMADTEGEFYFWEATVYGNGVVPSENYQQVSPIYPSWIEKGLSQWNFNSTGTKAICCPWRETDPPLTEGGAIPYKYSGNTYLTADPAWPVGCRVNAKEDEPGLVEVEISITFDINGEWTPSVTVLRDERFTVDGFYAVDAHYLIGDERLPYPEDTPIMLCYDLWIENGDYDWLNKSNYYYPDDYSAMVRDGMVLYAWVYNDITEEYEWQEFERDRLITRWNVAQWAVNSGLSWQIDAQCGTGSATGEGITEYSINNFDFAGTISNINLRTLTWARRMQIPYNPSIASDFYVADEVVAYGSVVQEKYDQPALDARPSWATLGYVRADNTKLELWSNGYHAAVESMPFLGCSWHPLGHYSLSSLVLDIDQIAGWDGYVTGVRVLDLVNFRINGEDAQFTHKDLFNSAYGADREYTYYSAFDDPNTLWEGSGTFRTFGIFRDK